MTKKEIKSAINKAVYQFAESLGYNMSDDADGSFVTFRHPDHDDVDDTIDYHRSEHYTIILNWASDEIKADAELIDAYAKHQIRKYNK